MAAPTPTSRATPGGIPLWDGFSTKITLGNDTDISFWEKTVTPMGLDGEDEIATTTMHNSTYRTFTPRSLVTGTPVSLNASYDPAVYSQIIAAINTNTTITITFADGSTVAFFGYLKTFEPGEVEEGEQPEAEITIVCTMWDPDNNVEEGPVIAEPA